MKNGEKRVVGKKMDRIAEKNSSLPQKKGQKKCDERASIAFKNINTNFIFYRLYLNLLIHLS